MKILFVSVNRENLPYPVPPIGLLFVMASVDGSRHSKDLLDLCFRDNPIECLRNKLVEYDPDVLAISIRNIQNADYTAVQGNMDYYDSLLETVRSVSSATVVLGGAGYSVMPRQFLGEFESVNYGIQGEGERAFPRLIDHLEDGSVDRQSIENLFYRDGETVRKTDPERTFLQFDSVGRPDFSRVDDRYFEETGLAPVQSQRGCPLHCTYCTYPKIEGRQSRTRDPEDVVDEMFHRIKHHPAIEHFFFVDATFNLPITYAKELCEEMIRRDWEVPWTCYLNPRQFDRELAELMAGAGCRGVEIGSDSGSPEMLEELRKGFRREDIVKTHELCEEFGILDCHTFLLAWSGSDRKQVQETLDFVDRLDPVTAIFMIWKDDRETLENEEIKEREELRNETKRLLEPRARQHPNWVVPPMGIRFNRELFETLRNQDVKGPLWQVMQDL